MHGVYSNFKNRKIVGLRLHVRVNSLVIAQDSTSGKQVSERHDSQGHDSLIKMLASTCLALMLCKVDQPSGQGCIRSWIGARWVCLLCHQQHDIAAISEM